MLTNISQAELKKIIRYDPETGVFTWRVTLGQRAKAGQKLLQAASDSYAHIQIRRRKYQAHRLAWLYVTGHWPKRLIDHVNGNRSDNRFLNLREADARLNSENQRRARVDNGTKLLGATRNGRRFKAQITIGGVRYFLGNYGTPEEAHAEYVRVKRLAHKGNSI